MTDNIEVLRGAVARGWCSPENAHKEIDADLAEAIVREVAALSAQPEAQAGEVKKQRRDLYNELADALGCDAMDSHEGRIARAKRLATTPPAKVPDGLVPPEAVEVKEAGGLLPTVAKGDWAIPNRVGARIVDARMAYGWNECRKEMLELLAAAQQPKE